MPGGVVVNQEGLTEMLILSFIKEFDVPRKKFDKANKLFIEFLQEIEVNKNTEQGEVFNADLLFTFNIEKINDYYSRDLRKALTADKWLQKWLKTNKPYNSYSEYQEANASK